ncbi:P-loop containing nucleoside triphosphate hydrolase protein [Flagelloscypha sp. PMI_526]|nr:P-loop containing nucleoside triphosphate hydrolase protein [Flagelloscypha sp. PMI_526]
MPLYHLTCYERILTTNWSKNGRAQRDSPYTLMLTNSLLHLVQSSRPIEPFPTGIPDIDTLHPIPGDVIEVQGPTNSGKSLLVYHIIASCISPQFDSGPGWNRVAIYLDTDGTFNMQSFVYILRAHFIRFELPMSELELSLGKLHVFRVSSTTQIAITLLHIPRYLAKNCPTFELGLVAIDSISAFYWQDKYMAETLQGGSRRYRPLANVVDALAQLRSAYQPLILFTNYALNKIQDSQFYAQHLSPFPAPFATEPASRLLPSSLVEKEEPCFNITHHITLFPSYPADSQSDPRDTIRPSGNDQNTLSLSFRITGLIRTPGASSQHALSFEPQTPDSKR